MSESFSMEVEDFLSTDYDEICYCGIPHGSNGPFNGEISAPCGVVGVSGLHLKFNHAQYLEDLSASIERACAEEKDEFEKSRYV